MQKPIALLLALPVALAACVPSSTSSRLVDRLGDDCPLVRDHAEQSLAALGPAAHPDLRRALADSRDPEIRARAARLLVPAPPQPRAIRPCSCRLPPLDPPPQDLWPFALPGPPLDSHVPAVNPDPRSVRIPLGAHDGVLKGSKFVIYRDDLFVATAVADLVGCREASLKLDLVHHEPQAGDAVSNHVLIAATRPPVGR